MKRVATARDIRAWPVFLRSKLALQMGVAPMSQGAEIKTFPIEELLLPFEQKLFDREWKSYFTAKRQNWLATLDNFSYIWKLFARLDDLFLRGFKDCCALTEVDQLVPLALFIRCHRAIRVAVELAFSTQMSEAGLVLRSAIETAAIAHKVHREPDKALVWLEKGHDKASGKAFSDVFERDKKQNLFPDVRPFLPRLHEQYTFFSEFATHTTVSSLGPQYQQSDTENDFKAEIKYIEGDPQMLAKFAHMVVSVSWLIENAFYDAFESRLRFDYELERMRADFGRELDRVRALLVERFGFWPETTAGK